MRSDRIRASTRARTITLCSRALRLGAAVLGAALLGADGTCQLLPGDMVEVPAGEFTMGSIIGDPDEAPVHSVYLDAFWIDRTEVTVDAYAACVEAGACSRGNSSSSCNWNRTDRGDHPVNCVTWKQAHDYCAWVGARLPTEAEWEKAARGTDARTYPWGEATPTCDLAVMWDAAVGGFGCDQNRTQPVGSRPSGASPYGAVDLIGNVWEWVNDWYGATYYAEAPAANPTGPENGTYRVLRGGSWFDDDPSELRASFRYGTNPAYSLINDGFRCARPG